MSAYFDHAALVAGLERARRARGLAWRQVALQAGLEPSTLHRIVAGSIPDLPRFAALVDWLAQPADDFIRRDRALVQTSGQVEAAFEVIWSIQNELYETERLYLLQAFEDIASAINAATRRVRARDAEAEAEA